MPTGRRDGLAGGRQAEYCPALLLWWRGFICDGTAEIPSLSDSLHKAVGGKVHLCSAPTKTRKFNCRTESCYPSAHLAGDANKSNGFPIRAGSRFEFTQFDGR